MACPCEKVTCNECNPCAPTLCPQVCAPPAFPTCEDQCEIPLYSTTLVPIITTDSVINAGGSDICVGINNTDNLTSIIIKLKNYIKTVKNRLIPNNSLSIITIPGGCNDSANIKVRIDPAVNNGLVLNTNGLYVAPGVNSTPFILKTLATTTLDLFGAGTLSNPLRGDVKISTDLDNGITNTMTGIFSPKSVVNVLDTITVDLAGNGEITSPLSARVKIDPVVGNSLVSNVNGLYVAPVSLPAILTNVLDTNTVDLQGDGSLATPLLANVKVSSTAGNSLVAYADGIFVPTSTSTSFNTQDTTSIDLSGNGNLTTPLSADVKISSNLGNGISILSDGIYSEKINIKNGPCISFVVSAVSGVKTYTPVIDWACVATKVCPLCIAPICTNVAFVGTPVLADSVVNAAYSQTISVTGTAPFMISNITKPSWMNINYGSSAYTFTGTPDTVGTFPVAFTITNCVNGFVNFTQNINVTAVVVPVSCISYNLHNTSGVNTNYTFMDCNNISQSNSLGPNGTATICAIQGSFNDPTGNIVLTLGNANCSASPVNQFHYGFTELDTTAINYTEPDYVASVNLAYPTAANHVGTYTPGASVTVQYFGNAIDKVLFMEIPASELAFTLWSEIGNPLQQNQVIDQTFTGSAVFFKSIHNGETVYITRYQTSFTGAVVFSR